MYVFASFEKTGNLRYISHLDLQRSLTRLLMRTSLPIVYSEGFNPHPRLTFAQPLSIFQESICEIAEFRLIDPPCENEVLRELQNNAPEGLLFTKVVFSEKKLSPCTAARYEITIRSELSGQELEGLFEGPMPVLKKTKTSESVVDISEMVREKEWIWTDGNACLRCVLPCGNQTLNPSYIGKFLEGKAEVVRILRTELFF